MILHINIEVKELVTSSSMPPRSFYKTIGDLLIKIRKLKWKTSASTPRSTTATTENWLHDQHTSPNSHNCILLAENNDECFRQCCQC